MLSTSCRGRPILSLYFWSMNLLSVNASIAAHAFKYWSASLYRRAAVASLDGLLQEQASLQTQQVIGSCALEGGLPAFDARRSPHCHQDGYWGCFYSFHWAWGGAWRLLESLLWREDQCWLCCNLRRTFDRFSVLKHFCKSTWTASNCKFSIRVEVVIIWQCASFCLKRQYILDNKVNLLAD